MIRLKESLAPHSTQVRRKGKVRFLKMKRRAMQMARNNHAQLWFHPLVRMVTVPISKRRRAVAM